MLDVYQQALTHLQPDPAQKAVVMQFERLYHQLVRYPSWQRKIKRAFGVPLTPVKGIYLWGGVGRGKTLMMDMFYHALPIKQKTRLHFHRFMLSVQQQLIERQGQAEPLKKIARDFAQQIDVLCFDEFYVTDIADAMILAELFSHLFNRGVTLVATSNSPPDKLYANGLQRDSFLPAIELIKRHTQVIEIQSSKDYRYEYLTEHPLYFINGANAELEQMFEALSPEPGEEGVLLDIMDRKLATKRWAHNIVWFEFSVLCESFRSVRDYIEIAWCHHTVLLSGVGPMGEGQEDVARRFIALIDELYERHVCLIVSASVPLNLLYEGQRHRFEFERTISRLTEMQSTEYLAKAHIP